MSKDYTQRTLNFLDQAVSRGKNSPPEPHFLFLPSLREALFFRRWVYPSDRTIVSTLGKLKSEGYI